MSFSDSNQLQQQQQQEQERLQLQQQQQGGGGGRIGGNVIYCDDHLSRQELDATCSKCLTTTGPMSIVQGSSLANINQSAQVHFIGQQKASATLEHDSTPLQVEVPAQTITTTLPAKRVVVEVPARQVQVSVPARTIQLESAPEIQVTTRPVIRTLDDVAFNSATNAASIDNVSGSSSNLSSGTGNFSKVPAAGGGMASQSQLADANSINSGSALNTSSLNKNTIQNA